MYHTLTPFTSVNANIHAVSSTLELYDAGARMQRSTRQKHLLAGMDEPPSRQQLHDHLQQGGTAAIDPSSVDCVVIDIESGSPYGICILCEIDDRDYRCVRSAHNWHVWVRARRGDIGNPNFAWKHITGEILTTKHVQLYDPFAVLELLDSNHYPRRIDPLARRLTNQRSKRQRSDLLGYARGNRHNQLNSDLWYALIQARDIGKYLRRAAQAGLTERDIGACEQSTRSAVERKIARCRARVVKHWHGHENAAALLTVMLAHIPDGNGGECWAAQRNLARPVGISRQSCNKWIGKLEKQGWLRRAGIVDVGKPKPLQSWQILLGGGHAN